MNERDLLMIPGPINFDPAVLRAMSAPSMSHTSLEFAALFAEALELMKEVWRAPNGMPFAIAGSGTLAMDMAVCNLVEYGDSVLVLSTGFFGDRMAAIAQHYGAEVTTLTAPLGDLVPLEQVEEALRRARPRVVAFTHVDTSTGVANDVKALAQLALRYDALTIVDGVCSIAGMALEQDAWGVDLALTASQKAVGVPPGLALLVASPRALDKFRARKKPVANYYADWKNWLPVLQTYLARKPSYFATPAVNLVFALRESLRQILAEGLEARIARHEKMSDAFKVGVRAIGLKQVPVRDEIAATTLTTIYFPDGITTALVGKIRERGIVVAGGLHSAIREKYFRVGHMGIVSHSDISATLAAIEGALLSSEYRFDPGAGVGAAERILAS